MSYDPKPRPTLIGKCLGIVELIVTGALLALFTVIVFAWRFLLLFAAAAAHEMTENVAWWQSIMREKWDEILRDRFGK